MSDNISELEEMVLSGEPEKAPDNSSLQISEWAYKLAVVILDCGTGFMIGSVTNWFYGVIWVLAGAIAFFIHSRNWDRDGNNDYQVKNAMIGMIVSVVSVVLMALASGAIYLTEWKSPYISVAVEMITVLIFFWNAFQVAMYRFHDDIWLMNRQIARAKANANRKIEFIRAGGMIVDANKRAQNERGNQYKKHGDRGAVDAAINKVEGRLPQQARSFGAEVDKPDFTNRQNQK